MVTATDLIMEKIKRYINELERHNIPVQEVILFGSYAKGNPVETSDIDIAVISATFSGDRFDDRRLIVPYRREIDSRIEPMPFKPEDFYGGGLLADEIKRTGKKLEI